MPDVDWDLAKRIYDSGATDRKISRRFKCDLRKISKWRHENGLPANHVGRRRVFVGVAVGVGAAVAAAVVYKAVKKRKGESK